MKTQPSSARRSGFTLIELLVAMSITTVIVSVLVSITAVALDVWQRGRSEVRASRQAKAMLDTMAKDLESFVSSRGTNFEYLFSEVEGNPPGPSANQSPSASTLTFFTAATDRYLGNIGGDADLGGDVSCVSYKLKWQDAVRGEEQSPGATFILYRLLVNPDQTYKDLLGKENLKEAFTKYSAQISEVNNFVCENVYQFTLTYNVEVTQSATGGTSRTFPVRVTLGGSGSGTEFRIRGNGIVTDAETGSIVPPVTPDEIKAGRVASVEVGITILSEAGVIRLNNRDINSAVRNKILAQESFQFSRTVDIPGM